MWILLWGDNGKLYRTYTPEMADGMAGLCRAADVVVPNLTEASHLLGVPYREGPYSSGYVEDVLKRLCEMGPEMAVLTGISLDREQVGTACLDGRTGEMRFSFASGWRAFITVQGICLPLHFWAAF